ncbi:GTPase Era, mitochondrial [Synchiropus picturatus]
MALRVCNRLLADSLALSRRFVAKLEHEPRILSAGNPVCCRTSFVFSPIRFISSETLLNRLSKSKVHQDEDTASHLPTFVPPDNSEQFSLLMRTPNEPDNSKLLKVAIIGSPNAGKSTLSNQLLGKKVFAVSKKVHTTRSRAVGVLTEDETQIVLLDTPGLTSPSKVKRHHLEKSLLLDPWSTVREADLIVAMVDVADKWMSSRLDFELLKCLTQNQSIPAILVLNKVDLVKAKNRLLDITAELTCGFVNGKKLHVRSVIKPPWAQKNPERKPQPVLPEDESGCEMPGMLESGLSREQLSVLKDQRGWPHFKDVFMLSSVDQEDVQTLKSYFLLAAKPGPWLYHSDVLTDQSPEEMCHNIVREKLLEYLPQEVPYSMTQVMDYWRENETGQLDICIKLHAKKDNHIRMVIGAGGQMVAQIARETSEDLSRIFLREVRLKLSVKLVK